jgi:hypothetical protein
VLLGVAREFVFGSGYVEIKAPGKRKVDLDERLAYLLGLFIGDGAYDSSDKDSGTISQMCGKSNLWYVKHLLGSIVGWDGYTDVGEGWFKVITIGCQWFVQMVKKLCGVRDDRKRIPDELFRSPRSVVVYFLSGLIDAGGKITSEGIEFRSADRGVISGVADLLVMLGHRALFQAYDEEYPRGANRMRYSLLVAEDIPGLRLFHTERHNELVLFKDVLRETGGEAPEGQGLVPKGFMPVTVWKSEPCRVQAFIMECATHEFIGMGQRSHNCNFGLLYELVNPEWVLANQTGWPIERCREFMVKYTSALARLYAWKDKVVMEGRTTGSIKNLYGFERRVYGYYHTSNRFLHKLGDRTCVNQEIQGLAAVMMRIILVKCWKMFDLPKGKYYGSGVRVFAPIHDEFDLFVPEVSILPELLPDFKEVMESVTPPKWPVRLRAELEIGDSMGETFVVEKGEEGLWLPKEEKRPEAEERPVADDFDPASIDDWVEESEEMLAEAKGFNF